MARCRRWRPQVVTRSRDGLSREVPAARLWGGILTVIPVALALLLTMPGVPRPDLVLVVGLLIFGFVFAVISSLHSYLILAYAGSEKAAEDVGFYYAANAAGRLMGIMLSGILTQAGGMQACLWGSAIMLAICLGFTVLLAIGRDSAAGGGMSVSESSTARRPCAGAEACHGRVRALPDGMGGALHHRRYRRSANWCPACSIVLGACDGGAGQSARSRCWSG